MAVLPDEGLTSSWLMSACCTYTGQVSSTHAILLSNLICTALLYGPRQCWWVAAHLCLRRLMAFMATVHGALEQAAAALKL